MGCYKLHKRQNKAHVKGALMWYVGFRNNCERSYRFGFNGQEKTDEIAGAGNHNTALFWEYETRLGRRWNVDPVDQVSVSNYSVMGNNPIVFTDVLGDKKKDKKVVNKLPGVTVTAKRKSDPNRITQTPTVSTTYIHNGKTSHLLGESNWIDVNYFSSNTINVYSGNKVCSTYVQIFPKPDALPQHSILGNDVSATYNMLGWNDPNNPDKILADVNISLLEFSTINTVTSLIKLPSSIHAGRTIAWTLEEELAMAEIKANPKMAKIIIKNLSDRRLIGYSKFQYNSPGGTASIHFVAKANKLGQPIWGTIIDFKFAPITPKPINKFW